MKSSDIKIEGNVATWTINSIGSVNGTYIGTFQFKCILDPLQQLAIGRDYRNLLGPNPSLASEHETFLAFALSQLKYRIISYPPFWKDGISEFDGNLLDEEIITEVLNAAINAEAQYKEQLKKRKEDSIKKSKDAADRIQKGLSSEDEENEEEDED